MNKKTSVKDPKRTIHADCSFLFSEHFLSQVLDFYRRPMLYYYNDCKYVLKTVSAAGTAAHFLYDILCSPKEVYNLRRKIEDEFTGGKIREEHGKAYH